MFTLIKADGWGWESARTLAALILSAVLIIAFLVIERRQHDPLVPVRIPDRYPELIEQTGSQAMFVQQYVKHDGHCAILPNEVAAGFTELRAWKDNGVRPHSGLHPETTEAAAGGQAPGSEH